MSSSISTAAQLRLHTSEDSPDDCLFTPAAARAMLNAFSNTICITRLAFATGQIAADISTGVQTTATGFCESPSLTNPMHSSILLTAKGN